MTTSPPSWFTAALKDTGERCVLEIDGADVVYYRWRCKNEEVLRKRGKRAQGLILLHGSNAHAHWFDYIAPFLREDCEVLSVSSSGQGESGLRDAYTCDGWAQELLLIAENEELFSKERVQLPVIMGHSRGGYVAVAAGKLFGQRLAGIIIADSAIRAPDFFAGVSSLQGKGPNPTVHRVYPATEPYSRFRLIPQQDTPNQFIVDHIAQHSVRVIDDSGRWTWQFDPKIESKFNFLADALGKYGYPAVVNSIPCKVAAVYGEESKICNPEIVRYMRLGLRQDILVTGIPNTAHHLFIDDPIAFVTYLRVTLSQWRKEALVCGTSKL